jgi:6-pyruvoyltetrahydropterin/6-carboxytetrahydropterin synthase
MTVFPDGTKERLHGHNYYLAVAIDLRDISFSKIVDFGPVKQAMLALCSEWKERTLLARDNPFFEVKRDDTELEFRLCGERYVLPRADVLLLPIDNIAVEPLAAHAAELLLDRLAEHLSPAVVSGIEVSVEENPGQGASCYRPIG